MSRLHEKDEPLPWAHLPVVERVVSGNADMILVEKMKRTPDMGVIICNGCGRWQDFPPPFTFASMRDAAHAAGWRRDGQDDRCPVCVT